MNKLLKSLLMGAMVLSLSVTVLAKDKIYVGTNAEFPPFEYLENGEITGCIVDGPLSLDLAIEPEAAFHKGTTNRKIVGDADVLLFPDIQAGNITYKCLVHTADVKNGNILTGTKAPVILTSRSDEFEVKVNSIALAAVVAEAM